MAAAIEDSAGIDHHTGGMHFSGHYALSLYLYSPFCKNDAVKASGNHDAIAFDLPFDFSALAQDHGLFGYDIALDVSIDAEGSLEL